MATGVIRLKLNSIFPGITNFTVVGIIIAKRNPKIIISKKDSKEISVLSFTIRDSPEDIVNVCVWGSNNYTNHLYNNYKIGDIVDLINSNIKFNSDIEEKYMPKSSSSFFLILNENSSQILLHDVNDSKSYKHLLRIPTCPQNMYLKIEDIHSSGKEMCGKFCSLLVSVRCINATKIVKTKIGTEIFLKEIIVMDKTHPTLIVRIWDNELIARTAQWIPKKTILAFSDLYLEWNVFRKNMLAVVSNKTIITENPITNEANDLKEYANVYLNGLSNKLNINIPQLSTITDIMTCKRVLIKSNQKNMQQFTTVLFAIVSKLNIDGLFPLVFNKCNHCGMNVESTYLICFNQQCPSNFKMEIASDELESVLNIHLSLTDSTGTLDNCILHSQVATKILTKVNNFQNMSLDERTRLKWEYLFTNCAIKLMVFKSHPDDKVTILVVDIDNEGPIFKFISNIPIY